MANRLQKQPVVTYVPGVKAVAGRPAYCSTKQVVTSWKGSTGWGASSVGAGGSSMTFIPVGDLISGAPPAGATPIYKQIPSPNGMGVMERVLTGYMVPRPGSSSSGVTGATGQSPIYSYETTCYPEIPAVPGSPARLDRSDSNGWNGGARSVAQVPVGSYLEVTLPDNPMGVMIGLSDGLFDHSYGHPSHALVARPSGITPVEYGQDVGPEVPSGSRVRIVRNELTVQMFVDGVLVHTSYNPVSGMAYADATLYGASDYVDDPVIGVATGQSGTADIILESYLVGPAGGTSDMNIQSEVTGFGMFSPGGIISTGMSYAYGALAVAGVSSEHSINKAHGAFSRPELDARMGRPEAESVQASGAFPPPVFTGLMYSGGILSGCGQQSAAGKSAEDAYFGGASPAATIYQLIAWESYAPDDQVDGGDLLIGLDLFRLESILIFALHEGMELSDTLDLYLVVSLEMYEAMSVIDSGELSLATIVELILRERMAITGSGHSARREALQYAVNAVTGAVSRYENFGFRQFATAGGKTYAIKNDGLYQLEGGTDNGAPMNAVIDFGASDFGTAQSKRISSVYAGIATDGDVYLRVTGDDGREKVYRAVGGSSESRAVTAKGLAARHWRVRLELVDASYADLDNIEIEIGVSQRRLRK